MPLYIGVRGLALHGVFALFLFRPGPLCEDRHFGVAPLAALIDLNVDHVVPLAVQPHDQGRDGRRGVIRGRDLEGPVRGEPRPQAACFGGLLDDFPCRHARLDRHFDESRVTPGDVELGDAKGSGHGGDGFRQGDFTADENGGRAVKQYGGPVTSPNVQHMLAFAESVPHAIDAPGHDKLVADADLHFGPRLEVFRQRRCWRAQRHAPAVRRGEEIGIDAVLQPVAVHVPGDMQRHAVGVSRRRHGGPAPWL